MRIWLRLSTWGSDAYALTPLVCSHLRKTALAAACRTDGIPEAAVPSATGINAWVLRNKIKPLIDRVGPEGCQRALKAGLDCERSQKRRPLSPELSFEQLLFEITRQA